MWKEAHGKRGDKRGSGGGKGVVPNVVPALRENVVPRWVSSAPRPFGTKSAHDALDYMRYLNERGVTLEWWTGEVVDLFPMVQERVMALERALLATQQALAALQMDVSMQRAEAVLDDHLREAEEKYTQHPTEHTLREAEEE